MANVSTIVVKEIIKSEAAVTANSGELLYTKLLNNLKADIETFIDFSGITYLTTAFLNLAIGRLYKDYTSSELNKRLHVINLSDNDLKIFMLVTRRARTFFDDEGASRDTFKGLIDE